MVNFGNLFFDFDMTLAYRLKMWRDTVRELLSEENIKAEKTDCPDFFKDRKYPWARSDLSHTEFFKGLKWWEFVKKYIVEKLSEKYPYETAEKVAEAFPKRYCDIKYWRVFEDTVPTLKKLRKEGYKLFILSNHVPEAREIAGKLKLDIYFDKMIFSSEYEYEKPNIKIFEYALKECGAKAENSLMIGDNYEADILGALKAGIKGILVRKDNLYDYPYYCKDFTLLSETIKQIK